MFEWLAVHEHLIMGIIFMVVLGPAVGNYACSVVYRLPRGQTPFERSPYCGHCGADLQPRDLFPILSWLSTSGRCRYCFGPIPSIYTVIELVCAAVFITYFVYFGISEIFILTLFYAVFVVILAAIQWQQGWISSTIYSYAFLCNVILYALYDGSIYGWVGSVMVTLVACLAAHRVACWYLRRESRPFDTPWIWWMVLLATFTPVQPQGGLLNMKALLVPAAVLLFYRMMPTAMRRWALVPVAAMALVDPILTF